MTALPAAARRLATAAPMPRLAPVTSARRLIGMRRSTAEPDDAAVVHAAAIDRVEDALASVQRQVVLVHSLAWPGNYHPPIEEVKRWSSVAAAAGVHGDEWRRHQAARNRRQGPPRA